MVSALEWFFATGVICSLTMRLAAASTSASVTSPPHHNSSTEHPVTPKVTWVVKDENGTCIMMRVENIYFWYPSIEDPGSLDLASVRGLIEFYGDPTITGSCGTTRSVMSVYWRMVHVGSFNFTVIYHASRERGTWSASRFTHQDGDDGKVFDYGEESYFKSPFAQAFMCNNQTTHSLDNTATASFGELTVQAFSFKSDSEFSKQIITCPANSDPRSSFTAIVVVASSIGSVVLLALISAAVLKTINNRMKTTLEYESL